jgi:hypothetical protein
MYQVIFSNGFETLISPFKDTGSRVRMVAWECFDCWYPSRDGIKIIQIIKLNR